jgi:hypothetical protein
VKLSRVEQAIVTILHHWPDEEIPGRVLRTLVQNSGFRRSAPAFYFTMMGLEDKGLVASRERIRECEGSQIKDRYYRSIAASWGGLEV